MRYAVTILPEYPWREAAPLWRAAEELGFDCALTYDHLVWSGLQESPWFAAMPTLAAAAGVTNRIALGTFVSSPNYRHPYTFARDVLTLHDLTGGRFVCGLGTGGTLDSGILGESLTTRERVARFHEFVPLLDRLLRSDHVVAQGDWYAVRDARTLPAPIRDEVPFLIAANGPKSLRLAAAGRLPGERPAGAGVGGRCRDGGRVARRCRRGAGQPDAGGHRVERCLDLGRAARSQWLTQPSGHPALIPCLRRGARAFVRGCGPGCCPTVSRAGVRAGAIAGRTARRGRRRCGRRPGREP